MFSMGPISCLNTLERFGGVAAQWPGGGEGRCELRPNPSPPTPHLGNGLGLLPLGSPLH